MVIGRLLPIEEMHEYNKARMRELRQRLQDSI